MKLLNVFFICVLCFLLTTCFSPLDYNSPNGDTTLNITLPGGVSSLPDGGPMRSSIEAPIDLTHTLTFTGPGDRNFSVTTNGGTITVDVVPGNWRIDVVSRRNDVDVPDAVGYGIIEARVGQDNAVAIQLVIANPSFVGPFLGSHAAGSPNLPTAIDLNLDMELSTVNWGIILDAIGGMGRNVNLNLSRCTPSRVTADVAGLSMVGVFDPRRGGNTNGMDRIVSLVLPEAATSIAAGTPNVATFSGFTNLHHINTGNNITTIGDSAFAWNQLTSVIIGNSVTTIEERAFENNQLTSVVIGNSVTTIELAAFANNQLTSVVIPNSVTTIGLAAFGGNHLTSVVIPNNVTFIGSGAFSHNQLASVIIPNSVTTIEEYAFAGNRLTSVIIPNSVTFIGAEAFENNQLTSIIIPNNVTTIDNDAFLGNPLTSITIGENKNYHADAFPYNFMAAYILNGEQAGTYIRGASGVWIPE
ncbi:MAG: leucine-rich repeat domain-containing protein [Spirochaetaceae bacterium]|nr:leucine-rich repeat domain-containing protein [Spirochaetaceae bacterium]